MKALKTLAVAMHTLFTTLFPRKSTIGKVTLRRDLKCNSCDIDGTLLMPSTVVKGLLIEVPFQVENPQALKELNGRLIMDLYVGLKAIGLDEKRVRQIEVFDLGTCSIAGIEQQLNVA